MSDTDAPIAADFIDLAAEIVCAYVAKNPLQPKDLPGLLTSVHAALVGLAAPAVAEAPAEPTVEQPTPAQIRKSITDDHLVSFVDGQRYKTLKRHLGTHGLDPYSYRQRYGLPADYPMVASSYAAQRSALAKSIGLGRPGAQATRQAAE